MMKLHDTCTRILQAAPHTRTHTHTHTSKWVTLMDKGSLGESPVKDTTNGNKWGASVSRLRTWKKGGQSPGKELEKKQKIRLWALQSH
jgi:hypothetical protein